MSEEAPLDYLKKSLELQSAALKLQKKNQPTLRDLFAMAALQGLLANPETNTGYGRETYASIAYGHADDMLKARK
jgi:hypothetical protein